MSKTISFKHSGNTGDIIYAMAGIKAVCEKLDARAILYVWLDRPGFYYEGAKHPLGVVTMNRHMLDMLIPLLCEQDYIHDVLIYEGQKVVIDLDLIRQDFVNMPYGHIARWYFYRFPDMACDLGKAWLKPWPSGFSDLFKNTIIVNRTSRYRNTHISYAFLRQYPDVQFVGTKDEYENVKIEIPNLKHLEMEHFLDLSHVIKSCKIFIGNQSMCFAIAEAIKAPRILEVCNFAPNVIPQGDGPAYDFYTQHSFEFYVEQMMNKL